MTQKEKKEELIGLFAVGAIFIGDLIDECFDFGQQHPCWISVEDKMPPFDVKDDGTWRCSGDVLIFSPLKGIFLGRYECDDMYGETYWIFDNGKYPTVERESGLENVTHWMPLPAPPVVSKSQNAHIIGTADHIKTALDVMERKGGEK